MAQKYSDSPFGTENPGVHAEGLSSDEGGASLQKVAVVNHDLQDTNDHLNVFRPQWPSISPVSEPYEFQCISGSGCPTIHTVTNRVAVVFWSRVADPF
jgi:hypothetical protein